MRAMAERKRALVMLEKSNALQQDAYDLAVKELGPENGSNAYSIACLMLGIDADKRNQGSDVSSLVVSGKVDVPSVVVEDILPDVSVSLPIVSKPVVKVAESRPIALKTASSDATSLAPATDPSKHTYYGIEVKRSKVSEAMEVIELAKKTVAQNHKHNPYEGDRGRNSWRNHLFQAALADEELNNPPQASQLESVRSDIVEIKDSDDRSNELDTEAIYESELKPEILDPFDDPVVKDSFESSYNPASRPPTLSRTVPFSRTPVKISDEGKDNVFAPPVSQSLKLNSDKIESDKQVTSKQDETDIHVVKPVSGRVFAHGQSSPMPEGLSEAIKNKSYGLQPAPITTPKPMISKPSFLKKRV